jgi:hypothetical protein
MKRAVVLWCVALSFIASAASAASIGIGAFAGLTEPIVQDDNGRGTEYGVRAPISLVPMFTVEPYFLSSNAQDKEQDIAGATFTRTGIDVSGFGANALLTMGGPLQFYPFAGVGSHKLKRDGVEETRTTYSFGLGLGISPMPKISVHLRAQLDAAVKDGASRKWGVASLGLIYNLIHLPPTP